MKNFFFLVFVALIIISWNFKREIILYAMPILINASNPIDSNRIIEWPEGNIQDKTNKPNIILILADDMGFNDVSFYNGGAADGSLKTPNIDKLAKEGVAFTNGYAASPVCSASRAAIMTGRYSSRYGFEFTPYPARAAAITNLMRRDDELATIRIEGVELDELGLDVGGLPNEEITVAELLQENGYYTAHIGKWHIEADPSRYKYDIHNGETGNKTAGFDNNDRSRQWSGYAEDDPKRVNTITSKAIKFIRDSVEREQPFFLQLSHYAVHSNIVYSESSYNEVGTWTKGQLHSSSQLSSQTERKCHRFTVLSFFYTP